MNGEGRSVKNGDSWDYEYDLKDHLGNTRVSFLAGNGQVSALQVKDYYPFGMEMTNGQSIAGDPTKYLYNGKELQDEAGLDFYDYGARFYDPTLGRWSTADPLASKYYSLSPFVYCADNPIKFIDPNGKEIVISGDPKFQARIFNDIQKLSSNKLLLMNNGRVVEASAFKGKSSEVSMSGIVSGGNKKNGTDLVNDIIGSNHKVTIVDGAGKDEFKPTNEGNAQKKGVGSGGVLSFTLGDDQGYKSGIQNQDGTSYAKEQSILGHELGHTRSSFKGTVNYTPVPVSDPDNPFNGKLSKEEISNRKFENSIRSEQDDKPRDQPTNLNK